MDTNSDDQFFTTSSPAEIAQESSNSSEDCKYYTFTFHPPDPRPRVAPYEAFLPADGDNRQSSSDLDAFDDYLGNGEPMELEQSTEEERREAPEAEEMRREAPDAEEMCREALEAEEMCREAPEAEEKRRRAPKAEEKRREAPEAEEKRREAPKAEEKRREAAKVEEKRREAAKVEEKRREAPKAEEKPDEGSPRTEDMEKPRESGRDADNQQDEGMSDEPRSENRDNSECSSEGSERSSPKVRRISIFGEDNIPINRLWADESTKRRRYDSEEELREEGSSGKKKESEDDDEEWDFVSSSSSSDPIVGRSNLRASPDPGPPMPSEWLVVSRGLTRVSSIDRPKMRENYFSRVVINEDGSYRPFMNIKDYKRPRKNPNPVKHPATIYYKRASMTFKSKRIKLAESDSSLDGLTKSDSREELGGGGDLGKSGEMDVTASSTKSTPSKDAREISRSSSSKEMSKSSKGTEETNKSTSSREVEDTTREMEELSKSGSSKEGTTKSKDDKSESPDKSPRKESPHRRGRGPLAKKERVLLTRGRLRRKTCPPEPVPEKCAVPRGRGRRGRLRQVTFRKSKVWSRLTRPPRRLPPPPSCEVGPCSTPRASPQGRPGRKEHEGQRCSLLLIQGKRRFAPRKK